MGDADKTRQAVTDAIDGDAEDMDAGSRRALYVLATAIDAHRITVDEQFTALDHRLSTVTKLLISTTVTFVIAIVTSVTNLLLN